MAKIIDDTAWRSGGNKQSNQEKIDVSRAKDSLWQWQHGSSNNNNTNVATQSQATVEAPTYDPYPLYSAMMDFLNQRDSKYNDLVNSYRENTKNDNLSDMNWRLRQWSKTYGSPNNRDFINGNGLTNREAIYNARVKANRDVDDRANEMMTNFKAQNYNDAFNLVNSGAMTGAMSPEQIKRLYTRWA